MMLLRRYLQSLALYIGIVAGGVTLFLILAPLFGYLSYSDRPGPGWYATLPALGWRAFWANAWQMLGYGLFLAVLFAIPGAVAVLLIRGLSRLIARRTPARILAALIAGVVAGYWMLGAGWYISASLPLIVVAVTLGVVAGPLLISRPPSIRDGVSNPPLQQTNAPTIIN